MGKSESVYAEFERELRRAAERLARHPKREMVRLLLLALEREEIVSVGYRESVIVQRLEAMPIDARAREVIHHALVWTWRDEESPAIYIRGALLRSGHFSLRVRAFLQQLLGAVAGWSSSVVQHLGWRQAPLSRLLALAITALGLLIGKVPRSVRRELRYRSFRDFCVFNVDADKTAALCWERLVELGESHAQLFAASLDDFRRMHADEQRHAQVFGILAAALDDRDRLVAGETADTIEERLRGVSDFFLQRERRESAKNPLGSGGSVVSL